LKVAKRGGVATNIEIGEHKASKREGVALLKAGKQGGAASIIENGELKRENGKA